MKRTPLRRGMVTPAVLAVFRSVGWGSGELVVRDDEGLHALLDQRTLRSEGGGRSPPCS